MCDYLLMGMPKRLARKDEELLTLDSGEFSGSNCRFRVELRTEADADSVTKSVDSRASDHVPEEIMDFNRVQNLISSPTHRPRDRASTSFCLDLGCSVSLSVAGCTTDNCGSQLRPTVNSGLIFSEGPAYWQLPVP